MVRAFIGFDLRMPLAYGVAVKSFKRMSTVDIEIQPLLLPHLEGEGVYTRPTEKRDGQLFDTISGAPMSTQFAISRFLIPYLCGYEGWALFCDSDFMFREDPVNVFDFARPNLALACVHHKYDSPEEQIKMDNRKQTQYYRKNWSSLMLINCGHPSNRFLTPENVNKETGRFLHGFSWLKDEEIGQIDEKWNWLEGHSDPKINPSAVHFTRGTPDMNGYKDVPYADEWNAYARELPLCKLGS